MRRSIRRICCSLVLLSLLLPVGFFAGRSRIYPVARGLAQARVCNAASELINQAVSDQIVQNQVHYDRIICLEKDVSGKITALKTNMAEVNRLKSEILSVIGEQLPGGSSEALGIPLGSLFLPELFSGKGPRIPVEIRSVRQANASFTSRFSQAGINQTLHRLIMQIEVQVSVLVLGKTDVFTASSETVVAETVIVGDVPETFLQTGGQYGTERENTAAYRHSDGS